jgi:hypothetical protein
MKPSFRKAHLGLVVAFSPVALLFFVFGCPQTQPPGDGNDETGNTGLTGKFVGAETCAQCHPGPHAEWSSTLHAGAFETLEAIGQGSNAQCVGCHSVGFGQDGGFVDRATTNALAGVQCENCHGVYAITPAIFNDAGCW